MYLSKTLKLNLLALLAPVAAMSQGAYVVGNASFFGSAAFFTDVTVNGNVGTTSSATLSFYGSQRPHPVPVAS